ncbi:MAG: hypothetical protein OEM97_02205 [Acidimicrobiia bacterium]|nr:hypothetical protein [Acidimicrobiia bacterium]
MTAAKAARAESEKWSSVMSLVQLLAAGWKGPAPTELAVTGFDPEEDLSRRAKAWSHILEHWALPNLLGFGAALAIVESDAWDSGDRVTATKALSDRRFLLADRILHWAVPWLVTVGSTDADWAPEALAAAEGLLDLGDVHRVAPALTDQEGLVLPGHDSLGEVPSGLAVETIAGGWLFHDHITQVGPEPYRAAAELWDELAIRHEGSARLWLDLAARARTSAQRLGLV